MCAHVVSFLPRALSHSHCFQPMMSVKRDLPKKVVQYMATKGDEEEGGDCDVECWENQRYVLFKGWGPYRMPTDRPLWSNRKGDHRRHLEAFQLPPGCTWQTDWFIEYPTTVTPQHPSCSTAGSPQRGRVTDAASDFGWLYAPDFTVPTKYCSLKSSPITLTRRRRWVRTYRRYEEADTDLLGQYSFWRQVRFYGFPFGDADSAALVEAEEQRHHESFHRLSKICRKASLDHLCTVGVSSIPPQQGSDELEEGPAASSASPLLPTIRVAQRVLHYVYQYGVAPSLREELWGMWCTSPAGLPGSPDSTGTPRNATFEKLSLLAAQTKDGLDFVEICQDVARTAPKHPFFDGASSVGGVRLRNLLLAMTLCSDFPGYHQAFSYIGALLLLNMSAERAFGCLRFVFQSLLPAGYHEQHLLQLDLVICSEILRSNHPHIDAHFQAKQVDISVFASGWLQGLFCAHFPMSSAARVFDIMFAEGNSTALVRLLLAFIKLNERPLLAIDGSCSLGQFANDWARKQIDIQPLLNIVETDKLAVQVERMRAKLWQGSHATPSK